MRLYGTYDHAMDEKSRVTLPADFRAHYAQGAVLVRLPVAPNCVSVFSEQDWETVESRFIEVKDDFDDPEVDWSIREIYMYMSRVVPDRQGRVLVQSSVSEGLSLSGSVKIVGHKDRLEIWNPEMFAREQERRNRLKAHRSAAKEPDDES